MERLVEDAGRLLWGPSRGTRGEQCSRREIRLAWTCASVLAAWHLLLQVVIARVQFLGRFDDGIEYTTVTYLLHGQLPVADFYQPYGLGLGVPGAIAHGLGFHGAFALRVVYGLFPALVTLLVVPIAWRRAGWPAGVLVGLSSLDSITPRYSMGFAALFGFVLMLERIARRTSDGSLRSVTLEQPGALVLASFLLSLAGWARMEYAVLGGLWAIWLALFGGGRKRWVQAGVALLFAALPTIIILLDGGATHLWWIIHYNTSSSLSGFRAQRGQPVVWHLFTDRLDELVHLHLASGDPGHVLASYGVAVAALACAFGLLLLPRHRRALLGRDPLRLNIYLLAVCAIILYGQAARFSGAYGEVGLPVFWLAGILLWRRIPLVVALLAGALIAYPVIAPVAPPAVLSMWSERPPLPSPTVPGLSNIPLVNDGGAASMRTLVALWRRLGLQGRATLSVELRNDTAWGNEAIVGFLLDAPSAAWPLTYDPGLVNQPGVERQTVHDLCADRAPVVQLDHDYPYPPGVTPYVGSRLLDEFLAVDYRVRGVAGFYRILLPAGPGCVLPQSLPAAQLAAMRDRLVSEGQLAGAGAIALVLVDRARVSGHSDPADTAVAALGGYTLTADELPSGPFRGVVQTLEGSSPPSGLAYLAARPWPNDLEALAAQTAWVRHRAGSGSAQTAAGEALIRLGLQHPTWPQAILNLSEVDRFDDGLLSTLAHRGAAGVAFDAWRRDVYAAQGRRAVARSADEALINDDERADDPLSFARARLWLSGHA